MFGTGREGWRERLEDEDPGGGLDRSEHAVGRSRADVPHRVPNLLVELLPVFPGKRLHVGALRCDLRIQPSLTSRPIPRKDRRQFVKPRAVYAPVCEAEGDTTQLRPSALLLPSPVDELLKDKLPGRTKEPVVVLPDLGQCPERRALGDIRNATPNEVLTQNLKALPSVGTPRSPPGSRAGPGRGLPADPADPAGGLLVPARESACSRSLGRVSRDHLGEHGLLSPHLEARLLDQHCALIASSSAVRADLVVAAFSPSAAARRDIGSVRRSAVRVFAALQDRLAVLVLET